MCAMTVISAGLVSPRLSACAARPAAKPPEAPVSAHEELGGPVLAVAERHKWLSPMLTVRTKCCLGRGLTLSARPAPSGLTPQPLSLRTISPPLQVSV